MMLIGLVDGFGPVHLIAHSIYGFLEGWDHYKSCRMGNACGAIVVTRHGCANFMPYHDELFAFVEEKGGF